MINRGPSRDPLAARVLGLLLALACLDVRAAAPCAASVHALRQLMADPTFALRWRETTMDDGKPLVLTILDREGALVLEFVKAGEGLWAESEFVVCVRGAALEARSAAHQVRLGPAANWLTRFAFAGGGTFRLTPLAPGRLRVEAGAWSGTFSRDADP